MRRLIRERMTVYVYTYGFRPSSTVEEQVFKFRASGRELTVRADYRTALYDMIAEVVDYDAYQLQRIHWSSNGERNILDVGANIGVTALLFSQVPRANVTCYEPDPGNCRLLQQNLGLNGVTNVHVFQAAVSKIDGTAEFEVDEESTGGHVARKDSAAKCNKIRVSATTLQSAVERCGPTIDLLKCDCEGGEYDIVEQITPSLAARIRNITIEVHDLDHDHNLQNISNRLSSLGYHLSTKPDMWERSALHLLLAQRD